MEEQLEEQMAEIVAEEASYLDSTLEQTMENGGYGSDEDDDMDDHNAASFLEVSLDPQHYDRSSDTQEDGTEEDDDDTENENIPPNTINVCPICERTLGSDEKSVGSHLCSHFTAELAEVYQDLKQCSKCKFGSDLRDSISGQTRAKMLAAHHAADHGNGEELLEFLNDEQLVKQKREQYLSKVTPKNGMPNGSIKAGYTVKLGKNCPVCDQSLPGASLGGSEGQAAGRTHVADHFLAEMRELMPHPGTSCPECPFVSDRTDIAARHLALAHNKLDLILQNQEAISMKRKEYKISQSNASSSGTVCPICGMVSHGREHIARHFIKELMEVVSEFPDPTACPECNYRGEKPQKVARHIALVHNRLDELLADKQLVEARKQELALKPNKVVIGEKCPVCDQQLNKQHSRVHVIWHFMDDLRDIVSAFPSNTACGFCDYTNPNPSKVLKHIALGHSKLDEMLQDPELLQRKREQVRLNNGKRAPPINSSRLENIVISDCMTCPVCDIVKVDRIHVASHFTQELNEYVNSMPDSTMCNQCGYRETDDGANSNFDMRTHVAIDHNRLEFFLKNARLIQAKRNSLNNTSDGAARNGHEDINVTLQQQKPRCPVCETVFANGDNRDHVAWHFLDELREFVASFDDPQSCYECNFSSESIDKMILHVANEHNKLEALLQDQALVAHKRAKAKVRPKKLMICPVCDLKEPQREHVARHFGDELLAVIANNPDPTSCVECDYKADKPKTLSIHVALVHGQLEQCLNDPELVQAKRTAFMSKPKKVNVGLVCPICDLKFAKTPNRDHVAWHYMDELKGIVNEFADPTQCPQCPYSSDSLEKMQKHIALGHSMLDALLHDETLLQQKRVQFLNRPKKGPGMPSCPICDITNCTREHVARHFGDELNDIVMGFMNPNQCSQCTYSNEKPKNVGIHIALVHKILDHFLKDDELVTRKRNSFHDRTKKVNLGSNCPVCAQPFTKGASRDHVCWHFMDELRDYVLSFPDTTSCNECTYKSDKLDNLAKHVALGHSKLDTLLQDEALLAQKREIAQSKMKKVNVGQQCPICDIQFAKQQNRDHVAIHFTEELREIIRLSGSESACQLCYYTAPKVDNLMKHYALGHSKLDEFLQDAELVEQKRQEYAHKPKRDPRASLAECPICGEKGGRSHVTRHFMGELMEIVNSLPTPSACNLCEYTSPKRESVAIHIALAHCKLDEIMADEELVKEKQAEAMAKPKRMDMGSECIICGFGNPTREHVARHFLKELMEIVNTFNNPLSCDDCDFSTEKSEYTARHVALVHFKLESFLQNNELVSEKIAEYESSNKGAPKRQVHSSSPLLPERKSQRTSKPTTRFVSEEQPTMKCEQSLKRKPENSNSDSIIGSPHQPVKKIGKFDIKQDVGFGGFRDTGIKINPLTELLKQEIKQEEYTPDDSISVDILPREEDENLEDEEEVDEHYEIDAPGEGDDTGEGQILEEFGEESRLSQDQVETSPSSMSLLKKTLMKGSSPTGEKHANSIKHETPSQSNSENQGRPALKQNVNSTEERESISAGSTSVPKVQVTALSKSDMSSVSMIKQLPPSISLTPALPRTAIKSNAKRLNSSTNGGDSSPNHTTSTINPQVIAEVNDSWAQSLLSKRSRSGSASSSTSPALEITKPGLVSLSPVTTSQKSVSSSVTLTPSQPVKQPVTSGIAKLIKLGSQKHLLPKPIGSVTLTPKGGIPAVSAQISRGSSVTSAIKGSESKGSVTLTPTGTSLTAVGGSSSKGSMSLTPAAPKPSTSADGGGSVVKIKRATQAKWQLKGPPGVSVTPVSRKTTNFKEVESNSTKSSTSNHEHFNKSTPSVAITNIRPENQKEFNGEEQISDTHISTSMQNTFNQHDSEREHDMTDDDDMVHSMLLEPQIILDTSTTDQENLDQSNAMEDDYAEESSQMIEMEGQSMVCEEKYHTSNGDSNSPEFCDVCSMELINHPDEMPCPPHDGYTPEYSMCPVCCSSQPTREHVATHFMEELLKVVRGFETPLTCNQCEDYTTETERTLAIHIALIHSGISPFLENAKLLSSKRRAAGVIDRQEATNVANTSRPSIPQQPILINNQIGERERIKCDYCDVLFTRKDSKKKHIKRFHSNMLNNSSISQVSTSSISSPASNFNSSINATSSPYHSLNNMNGDNEQLNQFGGECPVCTHPLTPAKEKDHIIWHFIHELRELVNSTCEEDENGGIQCTECPMVADSIDSMAKHCALSHGKLDILLGDDNLMAEKRRRCLSTQRKKNTKRISNELCPICDFKDPSREHISRHFMSELLDHVSTLPDQLNCTQCNAYRGEKPQNLAKHIALVHSMLDFFLQNNSLVQAKRKEVMARPKKIVIGDTCPVCLEKISKRDSRVHVIWHFMDDLRAMVSNFPDPTHCAFCEYTNPKLEKMAKHVALGHSKLDELLQDQDLVSEKQKIAAMKPKKMVAQHYQQQIIVPPPVVTSMQGSGNGLGQNEICPICDLELQDNECYGDHVAGEHFMDELLEYVSTFDDTSQCPLCSFNSDELEVLGKHLAIDHSKLDDLLADEALINSKRLIATGDNYTNDMITRYC